MVNEWATAILRCSADETTIATVNDVDVRAYSIDFVAIAAVALHLLLCSY